MPLTTLYPARSKVDFASKRHSEIYSGLRLDVQFRLLWSAKSAFVNGIVFFCGFCDAKTADITLKNKIEISNAENWYCISGETKWRQNKYQKVQRKKYSTRRAGVMEVWRP